MRKLILVLVVIVFTGSLQAQGAPTATAGAKCAKVNATELVGNKVFICIKKGNYLVWNSGISIKSESSPAPKKSPKASTSTSSTPIDPSALIPYPVYKVTGNWIQNDLQLKFKWDPTQPNNSGKENYFVIQFKVQGVIYTANQNQFAANKSQSNQEIAFKLEDIKKLFGKPQMGFEQVCIYVQDSFGNKSTPSCAVNIMPWTGSLGGGPVVIVPTDPKDVTASWDSAGGMEINFYFDIKSSSESKGNSFTVMMVSTSDPNREKSIYPFEPNTTSPNQRIILTKDHITKAFGIYQGRSQIQKVCVRWQDSLANTSSWVCAPGTY